MNTVVAIAGVALLSLVCVALLPYADRGVAAVRAVRAPTRLVLVGLFLLAGGLLVRAIPSTAPASEQAAASEMDDDVKRLRSFAGDIAARRQPPMSRLPAASTAAQGLPDVDTMIARLAARLVTAPDDAEGWKMLGWSYLHTDRAAEAAQAYTRAWHLMPTSGDIGAALAEALLARDDGHVGPQAQAVIADVMRIAPRLPKVRYLSALVDAERGDDEKALAQMRQLASEVSDDEPWAVQMRARMARLASAASSKSR